MVMHNLEALATVRDQIGACGIWCGGCAVGNGALRELSRRYGQLIEDYGLDHCGPRDFHYRQLAQALASLQQVPLCAGCRRGGGRDGCELRACATKQRVEFCGECRGADCKHTELLQHMRSGGHDAGLFIETGAVHLPELVEQWSAELKDTWPACILFAAGK